MSRDHSSTEKMDICIHFLDIPQRQRAIFTSVIDKWNNHIYQWEKQLIKKADFCLTKRSVSV